MPIPGATELLVLLVALAVLVGVITLAFRAARAMRRGGRWW